MKQRRSTLCRLRHIDDSWGTIGRLFEGSSAPKSVERHLDGDFSGRITLNILKNVQTQSEQSQNYLGKGLGHFLCPLFICFCFTKPDFCCMFSHVTIIQMQSNYQILFQLFFFLFGWALHTYHLCIRAMDKIHVYS